MQASCPERLEVLAALLGVVAARLLACQQPQRGMAPPGAVVVEALREADLAAAVEVVEEAEEAAEEAAAEGEVVAALGTTLVEKVVDQAGFPVGPCTCNCKHMACSSGTGWADSL